MIIQRVFVTSFLLLGCFFTTIAQNYKYSFEADSIMRSLPPDSFQEIPEKIRGKLDELGCLIPQLFNEPHNVVHGNFNKNDRDDWVILCSKEGLTSVIVFWDNSVRRSEISNPKPDEKFFQWSTLKDEKGGKVYTNPRFELTIKVVSSKSVNECVSEWEESPKEEINSPGIELAFSKGSTKYYWAENKWWGFYCDH